MGDGPATNGVAKDQVCFVFTCLEASRRIFMTTLDGQACIGVITGIQLMVANFLFPALLLDQDQNQESGSAPPDGGRHFGGPCKDPLFRASPQKALREAARELHVDARLDANVSDNDEDCSACGAAGDVVCCDGCPRSFHFECVGMVPSDDLPDEWYCNECFFKRYPSRVPVHKGVFAAALNNLEKSIPRAFSLPKKLQTRFEGVKAGADGDYEEITTIKTTKKKNGYEELPDFFKQRDEGQAVLCHGCQKAATDVRAIIPCSICPLYWHIDCLDPPLAVPPVLKTWRCPTHADETMGDVRPLAPAHRFRKIKGAQTITPALSRGLKNNGYIEVDWSDEPEPANDSGWPDPDSFGRTYKLPAQGIVLDFIEQLRRQEAGYGPHQKDTRWVSYAPTAAKASDSALKGSQLQRTVDEMQLALTLTSLKDQKSDSVDYLISALLDAADPSVLSLMAKSDAGNITAGHLTDVDKLSLRALLTQMDAMGARIRQLLGEPSGVTTAMLDQEDVIPNILSPQDSAIAEPLDKVAPLPVTEPTPPSTIDHAEGSMELD
ncbi:hypothetical protein NM208_g14302 [Fusarium decemcellulare]|uniref:Uncharacterized protein n=1 Tax=Fusarium decemcellulare TaxID=57161 RepID=A0ACC1RJ69_9HYPO|nr:hypothetical protein NM208_g14302 [Fusarium decemcellulare]